MSNLCLGSSGARTWATVMTTLVCRPLVRQPPPVLELRRAEPVHLGES